MDFKEKLEALREADKDSVSQAPDLLRPVEGDFGFIPRVKSRDEEEGVSLWLLTFTDVMALMLTFFVLLYSMSTPNEDKWKEVKSAVNQNFSEDISRKRMMGEQDAINISKLDFSRALNLDYIETLIRDLIEDNEGLNNVIIIPQRDHIVLSLSSDVLFESGQAEVSVVGKKSLYALGGVLANIRNRLEVIGHADPRPIQATQAGFASNWDLSLVRAVNVASVLENVGYERTITTRGISSARFDELPESYSEDERMDYARRVDILIMKDNGNRRYGLF